MSTCKVSCVVLIVCSLYLPESLAATYSVDRTDDPFPSGACQDAVAMDCSLREAISNANGNPGPDTIELPQGTYLLTRTGVAEDANSTGDLDVTDQVYIHGAGMDNTIVSAGGSQGLAQRVLDILSANDSEIHNLTMADGYEPDEDGGALRVSSSISLYGVRIRDSEAKNGGGAIFLFNTLVWVFDSEIISNNSSLTGGGIANNGNLKINDSEVSGNTTAFSGGGIFNSSSLEITGSVIDSNMAVNGGGIFSQNSLQITASNITGNQVNGQASGGGGIENRGSSFWLSDSFIVGNTATIVGANGWGGGGILQNAPLPDTANITNTRITDNHAINSTGGGISANGNMNLDHVTIDGNTAQEDGAALYISRGDTVLKASLIANHNNAKTVVYIEFTSSRLIVDNTTISGNTSSFSTIRVIPPGLMYARHLTFFNNDADLTAEISTYSGTEGAVIFFTNSLMSASCSGSRMVSSGGNIIGPRGGCGISGTLDLNTVADLKLGPLADNGGVTLTHLPLTGSPAIDFGANFNCDTFVTDQRDLPRRTALLGDTAICDAGAVEVQPPDFMFGDSFEAN